MALLLPFTNLKTHSQFDKQKAEQKPFENQVFNEYKILLKCSFKVKTVRQRTTTAQSDSLHTGQKKIVG
jgi:hypothetical protein